jgi:RES domain-containing protein
VTLSAWRIVKRKLASEAFSGEGARLYGGRWNSPGVRMVYSAESRSLAALEILVHLESPELLSQYVVFEVSFDETLVTTTEESKLPDDWQAEPPLAALRAIGDAWAASHASAVLQVPSAIIPDESLFLLNPLHDDFSKLAIGEPLPFRMDPRLLRKK